MNPAKSTLVLLVVVATLAGTPGRAAQYTVSLDTGHNRSLPTNFFGANGQERDFDWQSTDQNTHGQLFADALGTMEYGILRFPVGTGSGYWDWKTGNFLAFFNTPSEGDDLNELKREVTESGAQPMYVLNMLSNPTDNALCNPGGPTQFSNSIKYHLGTSPSYSTGILAAAKTDGLTLPYLELGNEYYFGGQKIADGNGNGTDGNYKYVYPDDTTSGATKYATAANAWIAAIKASATALGVSPRPSIAALAAPAEGTDRQLDWNANLLSGPTPISGQDALTLHFYCNSHLPSTDQGFPFQQVGAFNLFGSAFAEFASMETEEFGATNTINPAWLTEYNVNAMSTASNVYFGTWGHGLAVAAMSLKWMEESKIQMMVHHCVVGGGGYGDIFETTDGLHAVSSPTDSTPLIAAAATQLWGLTSVGLTAMEIDTAAKNQTNAEELLFTGTPGTGHGHMIADDYGDASFGALLGWKFTGATKNQLVILNLYSESTTVNLSTVVGSTGNAYVQISGKAGTYVLDGGYPAPGTTNQVLALDYDKTPDNLTENTVTGLTSTGLNNLTLPAFSLTRIYY